MSEAICEKHINVTKAGVSAVELLSQQTGFSQQKIKQVMNKGAVWISRDGSTHRIRRAKKHLKIKDQLHLYYNPQILEQVCEPARLIADEKAYSVWFKPYGMYSQGSKWGDHCTINRWVEMHLQPQRPAFLVHRLDRATSGLIVLAHSKTTANKLSRLFEQREVTKIYQARVEGDFSLYQKETLIDQVLDGKVAKSRMRCIGVNDQDNTSWVEIQLLTGRKHQIRRHLSSLGFPVIGDRLYGGAFCEQYNLQLQACSLSFDCPVTLEAKTFQLPENLKIK